MKKIRRIQFIFALLLILAGNAFAQDQPLFTFVVMGDNGCGCSGQKEIADRMIQWYKEKPFKAVLMVGDNIYGRGFGKRGGSPDLFKERFDDYYAPLVRDGVKFYAVLGNHDLETDNGRAEIADKKRFNILGEKGY